MPKLHKPAFLKKKKEEGEDKKEEGEDKKEDKEDKGEDKEGEEKTDEKKDEESGEEKKAGFLDNLKAMKGKFIINIYLFRFFNHFSGYYL